MFTKHLATMIQAGVPIVESLDTLAEQTKSAAFREVITAILSEIRNGKSLAAAMRPHSALFSEFYISLIEISEQSGTLDENLLFIAEQLSKNMSLRKKIQAAFVYPTLIISILFILSGFAAFFVLPRLIGFFEAFSIELPLSTKILLFFAYLFRDHGSLLILVFFAVIFGFTALVRVPAFQRRWHRFILRVPIVGLFLRQVQLAQLTRNFGVLLKSGVPIGRAVSIAGKTLSNRAYQEDLAFVQDSIGKGSTISAALEKRKGVRFPALAVKMIAIGEKTGNLDSSLLYLSEYYEEEIESFAKNVSTLLEPALLLIIGLLVGGLALAIITPIYELSGAVRR